MKAPHFVVSFICLLAISCKKDQGLLPDKTINSGDAVVLALHQSAILQPYAIKITLKKIMDGRCPSSTEVACAWEGHTIASFCIESEIDDLNFKLTERELLNLEPKSSIEILGHTIKMLEVTPWPESLNSIKDKDYRVKIEVQ